MNSYKILNKQSFSNGRYAIVPIRFEDRFKIMQWRNEQIYHLRQRQLLTVENQNYYFENVVAKLFDQEKPEQILFSYLEDEICIGYGGLVHINWIDKNAEVSFVMNTELERLFFQHHWSIFLGLIEKIAFQEIQLHKIYTYAFDLRPHLYEVLEKSGFKREAILKDHCIFNDSFKDVIIHSRLNYNLPLDNFILREANEDDVKLLFNWVNENEVRANSISQKLISWEDHLKWFNEKINSPVTKIFILVYNTNPVGQIRIDKKDSRLEIDYSIDKVFRGKGFGKKIVSLLLKKFDKDRFRAIVKKENQASVSIFTVLGFTLINSESNEYLVFEY